MCLLIEDFVPCYIHNTMSLGFGFQSMDESVANVNMHNEFGTIGLMKTAKN